MEWTRKKEELKNACEIKLYDLLYLCVFVSIQLENSYFEYAGYSY